jgi:hypothetical protein
MEFTNVILAKVFDFRQLAVQSREIFSDLSFPSTIGLDFYPQLMRGMGLAYLSSFVYI